MAKIKKTQILDMTIKRNQRLNQKAYKIGRRYKIITCLRGCGVVWFK